MKGSWPGSTSNTPFDLKKKKYRQCFLLINGTDTETEYYVKNKSFCKKEKQHWAIGRIGYFVLILLQALKLAAVIVIDSCSVSSILRTARDATVTWKNKVRGRDCGTERSSLLVTADTHKRPSSPPPHSTLVPSPTQPAAHPLPSGVAVAGVLIRSPTASWSVHVELFHILGIRLHLLNSRNNDHFK